MKKEQDFTLFFLHFLREGNEQKSLHSSFISSFHSLLVTLILLILDPSSNSRILLNNSTKASGASFSFSSFFWPIFLISLSFPLHHLLILLFNLNSMILCNEELKYVLFFSLSSSLVDEHKGTLYTYFFEWMQEHPDLSLFRYLFPSLNSSTLFSLPFLNSSQIHTLYKTYVGIVIIIIVNLLQ